MDMQSVIIGLGLVILYSPVIVGIWLAIDLISEGDEHENN